MFIEHSFYTMHFTYYIIVITPYNILMRLGGIDVKPILQIKKLRPREVK